MAGGGGTGQNFNNVNVPMESYQPNLRPSAPTAVPVARQGNTAATGVNQAAGPSVYDQAAWGLNRANKLYNQSASQANLGAKNVGQIATTDMSPYMNPYTDQVVNSSLDDMNRMRQMAVNDLGAQAGAAGAYGGSRHGVAEAETNRAAMQQAGTLGAQLRNQGYNTGLDSAKFDIANRMNANQMSQGAALNAAAGLSGIAGQRFGIGQSIGQGQMQQGTMQQALQQQLIDAGKNQYQNWVNAPATSLQYPLAALGLAPNVSRTTQTQTPGLFDFMSMGLSMF